MSAYNAMPLLRLLLSVIFLLLCACSSVNTRVPTTNHFKATGLVGVRTSQAQNSANFVWRESGADYHIELYGPMGLGATALDGSDGVVTLTLSNQQTYTANSPEDLMQQVLGWSLPVDGLKYWLLAKPAPGPIDVKTRDSKGHLTQLSQQGWMISYVWIAGQSYPHKIILTRSGVKATIVVTNIQ